MDGNIIFNAWVARQPDDSLWMFGAEPYRGQYGWSSEPLSEKYGVIDSVELPAGAFPEVGQDAPMKVVMTNDSNGNAVIRRMQE